MKTNLQTVDSRIRFLSHQEKRVLMVDFSNCKPREIEEITRRVADYVTGEPLSSVLILTNFAGASFDTDAIRAIQEAAVFDKPFVKKSALIGTATLPPEFHDEMKRFAGRELPVFSDRVEALKWLVSD